MTKFIILDQFENRQIVIIPDKFQIELIENPFIKAAKFKKLILKISLFIFSK